MNVNLIKSDQAIKLFSIAYTSATSRQRRLVSISALLICILYALIHWYLGNLAISMFSAVSALAAWFVARFDSTPLISLLSAALFFVLQGVALSLTAIHYGINAVLLLFPLSSGIFFFFHYKLALPFSLLVSCAVVLASTAIIDAVLVWRVIVALGLSTVINAVFAYCLAKDRAEIEAVANQDFLTCLPNRRAFEAWLDKELKLSQAQNMEIALAFIDIDKFKEINDTYGHSIGDEVLQAFAGRLINSVRGQDLTHQNRQKVFLARLSGDEFSVAFVGDDSKPALARFIHQVEAMDNQPIKIRGNELFIYCSVGIAKASEYAYDADQLFHAADKKMYSAKSAKSPNSSLADTSHENATD